MQAVDRAARLRELADEVARTAIGLQRGLVRAARAREGLPGLPTAQSEVIGMLLASGPSTPAGIASELGLASPTVSNLVTAMVKADLLVRHRSATDKRSVTVEPTEHARTMVTAFGKGRLEAMEKALLSLPESDRRWIEGALPSLELLLGVLQEMGKDAMPTVVAD